MSFILVSPPSLGSSLPPSIGGARINRLGLLAVVRAVPELGKTFDHIDSEWPGAVWSLVFVRPGSHFGSIPRLNGHRSPGRNRRQNPTSRISPGSQVPAANPYRPGHSGGNPRQSCVCRRGWYLDYHFDAPQALRWVLGVSFIAMAIWTLIPDKLDEEETQLAKMSVFGTTLVAFFLAEMGDKTQIATVALAAQFQSLALVVAGTTLGMMIANVPAVLLGDRVAHRIPVRLVHGIAAVIFAILGVATLLGAGNAFGI